MVFLICVVLLVGFAVSKLDRCSSSSRSTGIVSVMNLDGEVCARKLEVVNLSDNEIIFYSSENQSVDPDKASSNVTIQPDQKYVVDIEELHYFVIASEDDVFEYNLYK